MKLTLVLLCDCCWGSLSYFIDFKLKTFVCRVLRYLGPIGQANLFEMLHPLLINEIYL